MHYISWKQCFLLVLTLLTASFSHAADTLTTATFNVPQTYSNPGGAYIPPGNTVTVTSTGQLTFNYNLTIDSNARLILNGGKVIVGDGKRIILQEANSSSASYPGGYLELNNNAVITSFTSLPTGALWQGIECKAAATAFAYSGASTLKINGGTIQYATCAFTSFDANHGTGRIYAQHATFLNNYRSLNMEGGAYVSVEPPNEDSLIWTMLYIENSTFRLTSDFPYTPPDMVNLNGTMIVFRSCIFEADNYLGAVTNGNNWNFVNNTTAINGISSSLFVDQLAGSPNGCQFISCKNGITLNNEPLAEYPDIVGNSYFNCVNDISIMGSRSGVFVLDNVMDGPTPTTDVFGAPYANYCSVFLRNCRSYKMEGNSIGYDLPSTPQGHNFGGIVIMDCGDSNNVVYRNDIAVPTIGVGVESIGTNRNADATTGLKILCNTIRSSNFDIAILRDSFSNPISGIHNQQYIPGLSPGSDTSAANLFLGTNVNNPIRNYDLEANNTSLFTYKYNGAIANEKPVYRNFPTAVVTNIANTCPVRKKRNPQPSILFDAPDSGKLIIMDASAPPPSKRPANDDASAPDQQGSSVLQPVQIWLAQNKNNWAGMPQDQKNLVYQTEKDPMFDGAAARSLLARYEGKKYDPIVLIPKIGIQSITNEDNGKKIYPNPTTGNITVTWMDGDALLNIVNVSGETVLQKNIKSGITNVDLSKLTNGVYLAEILLNGKVAYQQKIVKQ
jgi:hypothetical protein